VSFPVDDLPSDVTLEASRSVDLHLPSYAGGGYSWSVDCPGAEIVHAMIGQEGGAPAGSVPQEPGVSEPPEPYLIPDQLTIRGISPGTARCRLTLRRPFDAGPPAVVHEFQVTVLPGVSAPG
jgi:hypothetical protein